MPSLRNAGFFSRLLTICGAGVVFGCLPFAGSAADIQAGPFFHEFSLTLDAGRRTEILGPLFSHEERGSVTVRRWTPLLSYTADPLVEYEEVDFAYPLLSYDRFGGEYRAHILQLFSFSGMQSQDDLERRRTSLFPIYFSQRSPDTNKNYTAFFPIYGHIKERFLRDEIHFIVFPLYSETRKRDVVTENYLYPIFHLREGDGLKGWQVWPLIGHEEKEITTRINRFGDEETVPGHDKFFALWPIFFDNEQGIGSDNPQRYRVFLPFYSLLRSPNRDSSTYLWPLYTHTIDREKKYEEWDFPWPLIVFARGEGKTANRVFPFFSQAHSPSIESNWYLWPLYKYKRTYAPPLDRERTRILFFLYSDLTEKNTNTGDFLRRRDFWPLYTHRKALDGNERLQILAPIEPILPHNKSIERNYSPVWSLWRSEHNPKTGSSSQSLLWNLYRRDKGPESKKCSLLFGLFQYQSNQAGKQWRIFYIPFRSEHGDADASASFEESKAN